MVNDLGATVHDGLLENNDSDGGDDTVAEDIQPINSSKNDVELYADTSSITVEDVAGPSRIPVGPQARRIVDPVDALV